MDALVDRMKIGIVGLGPGAGTGFLATSLAKAMTEEADYYPAVLELGYGGLFDCLGMDKRFSDRQFFSFHKAVSQDKSIRGRSNDLDGVNWVLVPTGESSQPVDLIRKLRLINNVKGNVVLCRLSGLPEEELWRVLWEMDRVLVVIDPLPSRMLAAYEFLCALRISELPIIYVVNKWNRGINRRELLNYLKLRKLIFMPLVDPEAVYGAEYTCRAVYDMPVAKKQLKALLKALISEIITISP